MKEVALGFLSTLLLVWVATEAAVWGKQRRLEELRKDQAAWEAVVKSRQEAVAPAIRRCLEQDLTAVYAVGKYPIVPGARLTAESFEIVCVEAK